MKANKRLNHQDTPLVLLHPIIAEHKNEWLTVYQAFKPDIGIPAAQTNSLDVPTFSKTRMTWIKPQFLWMMYRAGWGHKENQEIILKITLELKVFWKLIERSCLSSDHEIYSGNWKK